MKSIKNIADGLRWTIMLWVVMWEAVAIVAYVRLSTALIKVSSTIVALSDISSDEQTLLKKLLDEHVMSEFKNWQMAMLVMSIVAIVLAVFYLLFSFKASTVARKEGNKAIEVLILSDRDSKDFRTVAMQVFTLIDSAKLSEDEKTELVTRLYADRTVEKISKDVEEAADAESNQES